MVYRVEIKPNAQRQIKKLSSVIQNQIIQKLEELKLNPRPSGIKKLVGEENLYCFRVNNYRILYEIYDQTLLIIVVKIGHRRDIYRKK